MKHIKGLNEKLEQIGNRESGGKVLRRGELDTFSIARTFALFTIEELKRVAQSLRENDDWRGFENNERQLYKTVLSVIRIYEPDYNTQFVPTN